MDRHMSTPIHRDWISKSLAGLILGLALGMALSALYNAIDSSRALPIRGQLAMWIVAPVWLSAQGGVYFFTSGMRAWLWLGAATVGTSATALALCIA